MVLEPIKVKIKTLEFGLIESAKFTIGNFAPTGTNYGTYWNINDTGNNSRIVNDNVEIENSNSPLIFTLRGVKNNFFQFVNDNQYHRYFTLSNGNYIEYRLNGTNLTLAFYTSSDSLIATTTYMIYGNISYTHTSGLCFYVQKDSDNHSVAVGVMYITQNASLWPGGAISKIITDPTYVNTFFDGSIITTDDPYGTGDNQTPEGGYGDFDYTGDNIDIPSLPSVSASSCGFVGLYNPTASELKALADYMWTGLLDISTYKKIFGDPMDCILSVGIIPVTPSRSTNKEALNFGNFLSTGITAYKITSQFAEVDCGSITVNGASASAMDYAPFTKAELFLPFCGTHSLAVDEIMDSTLSVKYHIDLYTGACVAYVKVTFPTNGRSNSDGSKLDSVMYQFTGNVLATIPVTSANHAQFIQSVLFAAAATAATVASGGAAAGEAAKAGEAYGIVSEGGAAISAGSAIKSVMATKPDIMKSGNLTANAGFLGLKKPVLTLTQPNLCRPADEYKLAGMPKQASGTLSDFSGFTVVSACHLDNILCTDTERELILKALCEGVIV